MGDKLSARAAATAAGCPVVPGTFEPTEDPAVVQAFADEHGFPVAIKAGVRRWRPRSEGGAPRGAAAGRPRQRAARGPQRVRPRRVYVERYLTRPRHVEIQILADTHGKVLHLGERDCSAQRRHQKLIEEAPAPGLEPTVRKAMGEAAVLVSREVGYTGAGTCEFLYEDGDFYFLEMNTRLQVEHPVTELVTGIDLVHAQLRIAAGEPLEPDQDDIAFRGHAFEARVNAENVGAGFIPSPGAVTRWVPPSGPGVRVDAAAVEGWEVPRAYDSLIAKLITYGADREEARRKMVRALAEFVIEGVPTTLDFHRVAFEHPDVVAGRVSTVSVETEWDLSGIAPAPAPQEGGGPATPDRTLVVEIGGRRLEVAVFDPEGALGAAAGPAAGAPARSRRDRAATVRSASSTDLVAPMQGTIVKTAVAIGDTVAMGDLVLVLEAMKMENAITAHRAGVVTALPIEAGQTVSAGSVLATIEDPA